MALYFCFSSKVGKLAVESVWAAFCEKGSQFRINLLIAQVCRDVNDAGLCALIYHFDKIVSIKGDNQTVEFTCKSIDRWVFQAAVVEVVSNMFDIKPAIEARKALTRGHILVQQELKFIKRS